MNTPPMKRIFQSLSDKAIPERYQSSIIPEPKGISSNVIKRCRSSSTYNGTFIVCTLLPREEPYEQVLFYLSSGSIFMSN